MHIQIIPASDCQTKKKLVLPLKKLEAHTSAQVQPTVSCSGKWQYVPVPRTVWIPARRAEPESHVERTVTYYNTYVRRRSTILSKLLSIHLPPLHGCTWLPIKSDLKKDKARSQTQPKPAAPFPSSPAPQATSLCRATNHKEKSPPRHNHRRRLRRISRSCLD
jgi:hypothetical protein